MCLVRVGSGQMVYISADRKCLLDLSLHCKRGKDKDYHIVCHCRHRRGVEVWFYSFFDLGASWGWVFKATPLPLYLREGEPVTISQEDEWASGPVWTGAENFVSTRVRTPNRPARNETLYRLFGLLPS